MSRTTGSARAAGSLEGIEDEVETALELVAVVGLHDVFDGRAYAVERPEIVAIDDVSDHFAPKEQRRHRQFNVRDALRVRTVADRAARSLVT